MPGRRAQTSIIGRRLRRTCHALLHCLVCQWDRDKPSPESMRPVPSWVAPRSWIDTLPTWAALSTRRQQVCLPFSTDWMVLVGVLLGLSL